MSVFKRFEQYVGYVLAFKQNEPILVHIYLKTKTLFYDSNVSDWPYENRGDPSC